MSTLIVELPAFSGVEEVDFIAVAIWTALSPTVLIIFSVDASVLLCFSSLGCPHINPVEGVSQLWCRLFNRVSAQNLCCNAHASSLACQPTLQFLNSSLQKNLSLFFSLSV